MPIAEKLCVTRAPVFGGSGLALPKPGILETDGKHQVRKREASDELPIIPLSGILKQRRACGGTEHRGGYFEPPQCAVADGDLHLAIE